MGVKSRDKAAHKPLKGMYGFETSGGKGIHFSVLYVDLMDISSQRLILNDVKLSVLLAVPRTEPALRSPCRNLLT